MTKNTLITLGAVIALTGGAFGVDSQIDPYVDKGNTFEISKESPAEDAGVNKIELSKTEPAITISKWNGESTLTVKYGNVDGTGDRPLFSDKVEWKDSKGKQEIHAYPIDDEKFEIEIILNEKPDTNIFEFSLEGTDDLDFFYQPELTQEQINKGDVRPDNVVGSYAVYHKEKRDHLEGSINYETGKAYHIYRPLIKDANGKTVWGDLSYQKGVLTITIPQEFLDNASYPVVVDPTFGYLASGGTAGGNSTNNWWSEGGTPDFNGTVTSISQVANAGALTNWKGVLVYQSNKTIVAVTNSSTVNTSKTTYTATYATPPVITAGRPYWVGVVLGGALNTYFDAGGGADCFDSTNNYASPIDPTDCSQNDTRVSIYATYVATATNGQSVINSSFIIKAPVIIK